MTMRFRLASILITATCVCLVSGGCGGVKTVGSDKKEDAGPSGVLHGKVTFQGKKVQVGEVAVRSFDGKRSVNGMIDKEGNYRIEKAPEGKVFVVVAFPTMPGVIVDHKIGKVVPGPKGAEGPLPVPEELRGALEFVQTVPPKYLDRDKPFFSTVVKASAESKFDIALTK